MVGGTRKLLFVVVTWIWWSVFIGPAAFTAVAGQGNAGGLPLLIRPVVGSDNVAHGPSANSGPSAYIVGYKNLCMQAFGDQTWVTNCSLGEAQKWVFYPDGSIRPKQNEDQCLTTGSDAQSTVIVIATCWSGETGQVWKFEKGGAILNPHSGLVMDVRQANPSLHEIIIYPRNGAANQKWRLLVVYD